MALYRFFEQSLPLDLWLDVTAWSVQSNSSTTIKLLNTDGTYTVLHGHGFALNDAGEPIGGTVRGLERLGADGATVLERIDGEHVSLAEVRTAFATGGFEATLLAGNDIVIGTNDSKLFPSGIFEDFFTTGAGNDIVFGRGGANHYLDGPGSDLYIGGHVSDNVEFTYDYVDYSNSPHAIRALLTGGLGSFGSHVTFVGSSEVDTLVNFETIAGSNGDDIFRIKSNFVNKQGDGQNWIQGEGGNDVIHGNGQTVLFFNHATDGVYVNFGLGVSRSLNGDPAEDLANVGVDSFSGVMGVEGSVFDDVLIGSDGPHAELFIGGRGADHIDGGGGGHDRASYSGAPFAFLIDLSGPIGFADNGLFVDTLVSIEEIKSGEFDDDITMNSADNVVIGGNGNDVIRGLAGNDTLIGDRGDNLFDTAPGDDILVGGLGKDTMTGNDGKDTFDFDSVLETGKTRLTRDVITDFTRGEDLIDVSAIDANPFMGGDQAFNWRGTRHFSGDEGELRYVREDNRGHGNDRTIIEGDVNGDRVADFQIELTGLIKLTQDDFLL